MIVLALGASVAALIIALISLFAVAEIYAQVGAEPGKVRRSTSPRIELLEEITKTVISRHPAEVGLHVPEGKPAWYILFVSRHCGTCHAILNDFLDRMPTYMSIAVLGTRPERGQDWLASIDPGLADLALTLEAPNFDSIGLTLTPSVMVIIGDEMAYVAGVDSIEALNRVVVEKYLPPTVLAYRSQEAS